MATEPQENVEGRIGSNAVLLIGSAGYVVVNSAAIMSLIFRIAGDPFTVLSFFAFVAPVATCGLALVLHFASKRGLHPLALAVFIVLMLIAGVANLHFVAQASAAV